MSTLYLHLPGASMIKQPSTDFYVNFLVWEVSNHAGGLNFVLEVHSATKPKIST